MWAAAFFCVSKKLENGNLHAALNFSFTLHRSFACLHVCRMKQVCVCVCIKVGTNPTMHLLRYGQVHHPISAVCLCAFCVTTDKYSARVM